MRKTWLKIPAIVASVSDKDTGARVIYDADPAQLMEKLVAAYTSHFYRRPSCFCGDEMAAHG